MAVPALFWQYARFDALSLQALYDALQLRARVFILEQGPYLDPDGLDAVSLHLFGRDAATGALLAYLRVVDPGRRFDEPSIGRVITAPEVRGQGLGPELMRRGIAACAEAWPGRGIRISAQARLERFYAGLGFQAVGEPYDEDGIPHLEMLRPADPAQETPMSDPTPLERWHQVLRERDVKGLRGLIAEDARFHSPVVHRPQVGRDLVHAYLAAAFSVLGQDSFRYLREIIDGREAVLEFSVTLDGIEVNGVDMIRWNEAGLIEDFKVMVRPLKAIQLLHERMAAMLQQRAASAVSPASSPTPNP